MFGTELSSTSYLIVAHKIRLFQYWNNQYKKNIYIHRYIYFFISVVILLIHRKVSEALSYTKGNSQAITPDLLLEIGRYCVQLNFFFVI